MMSTIWPFCKRRVRQLCRNFNKSILSVQFCESHLYVHKMTLCGEVFIDKFLFVKRKESHLIPGGYCLGAGPPPEQALCAALSAPDT